jgi:hypothetical protein
VKRCPTQFTTSVSAPDDCRITPGQELIISFKMNYPKTEFANLGTMGAAYTVSIKPGTKSGKPAKNRGIHFDASEDVHIALKPVDDNHGKNLILNSTWSFHAWALFTSMPAAGGFATLFSKDRADFSSASSANWIALAVNSDKKISARLAEIEDAS